MRGRRDVTYAIVREIDSILDEDAAGAADLGQATVGSGSDESTVRSSQDNSHAVPSRAAIPPFSDTAPVCDLPDSDAVADAAKRIPADHAWPELARPKSQL
jgi:hypothetical protein